MKRYAIYALALVMCGALLTGCRRANNMQPSSPTNNATTAAPTMPTVMPQTTPVTEPVTRPTERETTESTTGTTEDATGATEHNRSRMNPNRPAAR